MSVMSLFMAVASAFISLGVAGPYLGFSIY